MFNLSGTKNVASNVLGRSGLILKKYSPEIMVGLGVAGVVTSTVLACQATLKVDHIKRENKKIIKKIEDAKASLPTETYSEEDYQKDLSIAKVQGVVRIGKLYIPAVSIGIASLGLILGSHGIMSGRNSSLLAAYNVLDTSYKAYRRRVMADVGPEKEQFYRYGIEEEVITETVKDEEGKETTKKTNALIIPPCTVNESLYARWFDKNSSQFRKDYSLNMYFLQAQERYANDKLNSKGNVFLNEIYDDLGLPRSKEGAIVGWVKDHGDGFISFNLFNPINEQSRDFVNGYEEDRGILLDFNVDGVIYDMI